ncbi:adenosylcobinamide-phosphate synthase CbiB [Camelimonas abortus]|uniref:Cobalamin biosynthesis protein CobD n=1 Tax=Camelimonas abortus TaxID=1017184 RepID=A0ABV7LIH9_9HYPH
MCFALAFTAMAIERVTGYPAALLRRIGHPVTWIGAIITALETRLNRSDMPALRRQAFGLFTLILLVLTSGGAAFLVEISVQALLGVLLGFMVTAVVASALVAQRSLDEHVQAVADALERDGLAGGRRAASMIVGRDPDQLDEAAVCRAALESLAENYSDGVTAPVFWLAIGGLPGGAIYKAINTADSMIGHLNDRYRDFGRAAARLDDLVNLPASRLSALTIIAAAALTDGANARASLAAVRRDARLHRSPNAGWPEAAMAGALGLELAGPRVYGGVLVDDAAMGRGGRREAHAADIRQALRLYRRASLILMALIVIPPTTYSLSWIL